MPRLARVVARATSPHSQSMPARRGEHTQPKSLAHDLRPPSMRRDQHPAYALRLEASIKRHSATLLPLAMVLPLLIVGGLGVGGATGYGMYQLGSSLALPARLQQSPPPKGFGALSAGAFSAGAAYSLQWRVLNRHLAHLLTYEVPQNVAKWRARDFLRLAVPIVAPHVAMFSSSLAVMGFVATKVAVGGATK